MISLESLILGGMKNSGKSPQFRQQCWLLLTDEWRMSTAEIARYCDYKDGSTVSVGIRRARERLRSRLKESGYL